MDQPGLGISLSGGGLRAASFGFGCLQELDARLGVLRGPRPARYLAAVSGGSYSAAAVSVDGTAGIGAGSSLATRLAAGCDYFRRDRRRAVATILVAFAFNFLGLVATILILPILAVTFYRLGLLQPTQPWLTVVGVVGLVAVAAVMIDGVLREPGPSRRRVVIFVAAALTMPSAVAVVVATPALSSPMWLLAKWPWLLGAAAGAAAVAFVRSRATGWARVLGAALETVYRGTQVLSVAAIFWATALMAHDTRTHFVLFFFGLITAGFFLFNAGSDWASLHYFYAGRVASCFGASTGDPLGYPMSRLRDVPGPELLVCAAANARSAHSPVASMVMSPTNVRLYGPHGVAQVDTVEYERFVVPHQGNATDRRAVLSVFRAVGLSGAAVSPSMGFATVHAVRGLLAVANVRLGRWMPNPASPVIQDILQRPGELELRLTQAEALREFWGHHPARAPLIYVTDGGHYENLGLVELLRRRCAVVVAVDSSGGPPGAIGALRHALDLAYRELRVEVDMDLTPLQANPDQPGTVTRCWTLGDIKYDEGTTGKLLLIRIGLDAGTPPDVVAHRQRWRKFPHQSTLDQFYDADRFTAYAALGRASMAAALSDVMVAQALRGNAAAPDRSTADQFGEPTDS